MTPEENERLYKEAVHAACQVIGVPPEQEREWDFRLRDLWRRREDGLWEWMGLACPPFNPDGPLRYIRDEQNKSWVGIPVTPDPLP